MTKGMFYIFHGEDSYSQKETLAELQSKMGDPSMLALNTSRFEGKNVTLSQLLHACDSIPFLSEKRLVITEDLISNKPPFLEELLDYLPNLPETTRLVFLESRKIPASNRFMKAVKANENGYVKLFDKPKGGSLEKWIRDRVREAGGEISPHAAHLLALNVGNELGTLDNEIEKLVLYKGNAIIEAEDVTLLCPYVAETSIFDLVDAIGSRHGPSSAQLLQRKLAEGEDPVRLFSMIVRQFRLLIQVKELAGAGLAPPTIAAELNIHGFVAGKLFQQSHNFNMEQLEAIYAHLLEMDVGVKTGRTDMVTALDLLVAGISV